MLFLCGKAVCELPDDVFMAKRQILAGLLEKNMVPEGWKPDPAQFLGTCCGSFRARGDGLFSQNSVSTLGCSYGN